MSLWRSDGDDPQHPQYARDARQPPPGEAAAKAGIRLAAHEDTIATTFVARVGPRVALQQGQCDGARVYAVCAAVQRVAHPGPIDVSSRRWLATTIAVDAWRLDSELAVLLHCRRAVCGMRDSMRMSVAGHVVEALAQLDAAEATARAAS